jgi:hypothetical protein
MRFIEPEQSIRNGDGGVHRRRDALLPEHGPLAGRRHQPGERAAVDRAFFLPRREAGGPAPRRATQRSAAASRSGRARCSTMRRSRRAREAASASRRTRDAASTSASQSARKHAVAGGLGAGRRGAPRTSAAKRSLAAASRSSSRRRPITERKSSSARGLVASGPARLASRSSRANVAANRQRLDGVGPLVVAQGAQARQGVADPRRARKKRVGSIRSSVASTDAFAGDPRPRHLGQRVEEEPRALSAWPAAHQASDQCS